jgi:hypothetical protein
VVGVPGQVRVIPTEMQPPDADAAVDPAIWI